MTATLQGDSTRTTPTVVTIGTLAGTATKDTDYTVTTLGEHHDRGQRDDAAPARITVTPTDDAVVEGDETIVIPGTTTDAGGAHGQFGDGDVDGRRQEHDDAWVTRTARS